MQVPCRYPDQCQEFGEIGLLSLWLRVSQGVSLVNFVLAAACPIEKVVLLMIENPNLLGH